MRFYPRRFRLAWVGMAITWGVLWLSVVSGVGGPADDTASSKLGPGLSQLIATSEGVTEGALPSGRLAGRWVPGTRPEELQAGQVRVTLIARSMDDVPAVMDQVRTHSGTVETSYQTWVQALVPITALVQLSQLPQVRLIRLPDVLHTTEVVSQGVGISGADVWQKAGFTGKGVKVAVLDTGFRGYKNLLGKELPPTVVTKSFRKDGQIEPNDGDDSDVHGLAVAEIVHDMAPDAQLYFVNSTTGTELFNALDWLISQKVDIINFSAGFNTGCYTGNGEFDNPAFFSDQQGRFAAVRKAGILFVNSGGNDAESHWAGTWQDPDNNGELNFTASDNAATFNADRDDPIFVELSWDDDPCFGATDDYDLFLEDGSGQILASSTDRQLGRNNDFSRERVSLKAPYTGQYRIVVKQVKATRPVRLNLFAFDFLLTPSVAAGSLTEPSISANVMTVGAADSKNLTLEPFSSQGPTLDGRIKPDVTGVDDVATVTFSPDPFFGTSASSPQVAGAAALVKQANPSFGPDQIQRYLEQHAEDLGPPGKDNQYGAGLLIMGAVPTNAPTVPAPPSDLKANALSGSSIQLTWKDNANNETGFKIERRLQSGSFSQITVAKADATSFTDTALNPATTYCYRVRATNDAGNSDYSNEACVTTQAVLSLINSIEPAEGLQGSSIKAVIKGQRLSGAKSVVFSGLGVTAVIEAGGSDTALPITIIIAPDAAPGLRTFTVTASAGTADSGAITFTVKAQAGPGVLVALRFDKLEFLVPDDWSRALQNGCVVYTNVAKKPSIVRLTLPDKSVAEYAIPAGNQVIVCGDVAHIDTRPKSP